MGNFTFEEINLLCIYNPGTRQGAIEALTEMRGHLPEGVLSVFISSVSGLNIPRLKDMLWEALQR